MSELLAGAGVLLAAGSAATAILLPAGRARSAAMLAALALVPSLILADQWHTPQIADLRDDPARLVLLASAALAATAALASALHRWPLALPLAIVFVLPFRIPLESGGDTANLLVPLYLVIAAGVLATAFRDSRVSHAVAPVGGVGVGGSPPPEGCGGQGPDPANATSLRPEQRVGQGGPPTPTTGPAGQAVSWLPRVLAAVVLLYALQTLYSPDFSKSLQNVCFFFVPFSLVYALLRDLDWSPRLLALVLWVVAAEALAFVVVGTVEYATGSLFWNDHVIRSNEFHTYFRVNSIFWDPNIYGRYLALAIAISMAVLLWARDRRTMGLLTALVAILWFGLVPTFSQSSFLALLAGLAVLAALRWSVRWTLVAVGAGAALAVVIVLFAGGVSKLSPDRFNVDTSGRANLISGGTDLFAKRPLWGYGAGSFPRAYSEHIATKKAPVSVSHTQPVTVAAEQGLIGLAAYAALLATALWTLAAGLRSSLSGQPVPPVGGIGGGGVEDAPARSAPPPPMTGPAGRAVGRAAILAAFVALLVHTLAYAGFYEDPIAWVLLAVGASLASGRVREAP